MYVTSLAVSPMCLCYVTSLEVLFPFAYVTSKAELFPFTYVTSSPFHGALRPQKPYGLLGTGSPGQPLRLSHTRLLSSNVTSYDSLLKHLHCMDRHVEQKCLKPYVSSSPRLSLRLFVVRTRTSRTFPPAWKGLSQRHVFA